MLEKVLTYRLPGDIPTIRYNRKCTLAFDNKLCSQTCVVFSLLKMRAIANFVYVAAMAATAFRTFCSLSSQCFSDASHKGCFKGHNEYDFLFKSWFQRKCIGIFLTVDRYSVVFHRDCCFGFAEARFCVYYQGGVFAPYFSYKRKSVYIKFGSDCSNSAARKCLRRMIYRLVYRRIPSSTYSNADVGCEK